MQYKFSIRSLKRLKGVHDDLIRVLVLALQITDMDFGISEGRRTLARQKKLKAAGKSQILNSRHLTGHAVDIFAWHSETATEFGKSSWTKHDLRKVWNAIQTAANLLKVEVKWGGNWRKFMDAPHIELSRKSYPIKGG